MNSVISVAFKENSPPFSYFVNGKFRGIELNLLELIADKTNSTIEYGFEHHFSHADIIAGGLSSFNSISPDYEALVPYIWDEIIVCLKNPPLFPRWLYLYTITVPHQGFIWIIAAIESVLTVILSYLLSGAESHPLSFSETSMIFFGALIGFSVPISRAIRNVVSRLIFAACLAIAFFGVSIFGAYFYNVLMETKYENKLLNINEIRDRQFDFLSTPELLVSN